jgi:hypothetical protein
MAIDVAGRLRFRGRTRSGSRNRQAASRDNRRSGVHGVNGLSDGLNPHLRIGWWLNRVSSREGSPRENAWSRASFHFVAARGVQRHRESRQGGGGGHGPWDLPAGQPEVGLVPPGGGSGRGA